MQKYLHLPQSGEAVLLCPKCGHDYVHTGLVYVNARQKEDAAGTRVVVQSDEEVSICPRAEMPGRRWSIGIEIDCEECGAVGFLRLLQHKGQTMVEVIQ